MDMPLPSGNFASTSSENVDVSLSQDSHSPRLARDALVLGLDRSIHKTTSTTPSMGSSVEPTAQWQAPQKRGISQPTCLAPGLQEKWPGGFEPEVEDRHLRGVHLEPSTPQGGPYMGSGVHRARWMSPAPLCPK